MNAPYIEVFGHGRRLIAVDPTPRRSSRLPVVALLLAIFAGVLLADRAVADEAERYEPTSRGAAVERWRPLLEQYDWNTDTALLVVYCESRGDAAATNPTSGAAGLFQLLGWDRFAARLFGRWVSLYDPAVNARVAYALYVDSGERFGFHWAASRGCWAGGW